MKNERLIQLNTTSVFKITYNYPDGDIGSEVFQSSLGWHTIVKEFLDAHKNSVVIIKSIERL